jgi:hypothetical protein
MRRLRLCILLPLLFLVTGCVTKPENPSFPLTVDRAQASLASMREQPRPTTRPIVIISGFNDPGIGGWLIREELRPLLCDGKFILVALPFTPTFEECRHEVIAAVDRASEKHDPAATVEVDVIGVSMGGLVARYAAMPIAGERRLRAARIFTVSSPHQGAKLAFLPTWDGKQIAMRPGSRFLQDVAAGDATADYELVPYVRLGDVTVGERNAAPPGKVAWWVPNRLLQLSHGMAGMDPRIVADIARRLRGEEPFTKEPRAPLPVADAR